MIARDPAASLSREELLAPVAELHRQVAELAGSEDT
jgi:hypothetical protein